MKIPLFLSAVLVILLSFLLFNLTENMKEKLVSPFSSKGKTLGINQWFPREALGSEENPEGVNALQITAKAALFMDSKTGEILYAKNIHERLPVASLVKVMTVLIALENKNLDDKFLVSKRATEMEPDEMILLPGEKLTLKELLYGIFLVSANDAAEVLAEGVASGREEFIGLMNDKAKLLGMKDSYFSNPTGLDEDIGNSYSSAYDLAILTRHLIKNYPEIVKISSTPYILIPATAEHRDFEMYSGINLLTSYPGVVGFKTGYTPQAGFTLITLARKDDHEVIGVLLGSEDRREEARILLDYSFEKLRN